MSNYFNDYIYTSDDTEEKLIVSGIETAKSRYLSKKKQVEEEKYIERLLFEDYVRSVKCHKNTYDYMQDIIEKAFFEQNEKYKKDRTNFEFLKEKIKSDFFNGNKIDIKNITCGGYDGYYYRVEFYFENQNLALCLPIVKNITTNNIYDANVGKIILYIANDSWSCYDILVSSYSVEEIANYIQKNLLTNE